MTFSDQRLDEIKNPARRKAARLGVIKSRHEFHMHAGTINPLTDRRYGMGVFMCTGDEKS